MIYIIFILKSVFEPGPKNQCLKDLIQTCRERCAVVRVRQGATVRAPRPRGRSVPYWQSMNSSFFLLTNLFTF